MKHVLLTGFEPFDGESINPSAEIARQLHGAVIGGCRVQGALLPCVFGEAEKEMRRLIRTTRPVLVVAVGQAGGRAEVTPERVAINVADARIPDNAGRQPIDRPVVRGGPTAYWTGLPVKSIVAALREKGIPAAVSLTAGTFVCNQVFYSLMHALKRRRGVRGGFIHVPFLPEQAKKGQPSLPLDAMTRAVALAIGVSLRVRRDRKS